MKESIVRFTKIAKFFAAIVFVIAVSTTTFAQQTREEFFKAEVAKVTKQIAAKPNDDKLYVKRGEYYLNIFNYYVKEALADADKALKINPKNSGALKVRKEAMERIKYMQDINDAFKGVNFDSYFVSEPESQGIPALTKRIADNPQNSDSYVERGELYLKDKKLTEALADAEKALKIRPSNSYAMMLRSDVKTAKKDKSGADADYAKAVALRKESSIVGKVVSHTGKTLTGIVAKGKVLGNASGYSTLDELKKDLSIGIYTKVLIKDKKSGTINVYEAIVSEDNEKNITMAETGYAPRKQDGVLDGYEYMKLAFDQSMFLPKTDRVSAMLDFEVIDVLDVSGLSLIRRQTVTFPPNDNAFQDLMESEIATKHFDEAKAIYLHTEKLGAKAANQNPVQFYRKIYLRKLFQTTVDIKKFVEKEMDRYRFTEAEKRDIRTVKFYV